jgi:hypothetical protein
MLYVVYIMQTGAVEAGDNRQTGATVADEL